MQNPDASPGTFNARGHTFPLSRTYVMGILNVTPDSFSDGGEYFSPQAAIARAKEMAAQGADILDVGGQSTRPGHTPVTQEEEWERLKNVLPALVSETGLAVSVDTFYPWVARKALLAGAHIINDVSGFPDAMLAAAAESGCGCIVMYPVGGGAAQARAFFQGRLEAARRFGIGKERLCFDPGIGFGKTREEDLGLIAQVGAYRIPGVCLLMAASRKRVTGFLCGNPPFEKRLPATIACHTAAILAGADMVRVHDVAEGVQAAKMADGLRYSLCGKP